MPQSQPVAGCRGAITHLRNGRNVIGLKGEMDGGTRRMTVTRRLEGKQEAEKWPEKSGLSVVNNDLSDEISKRLIRKEACPTRQRLQCNSKILLWGSQCLPNSLRSTG